LGCWVIGLLVIGLLVIGLLGYWVIGLLSNFHLRWGYGETRKAREKW